MEMDEADEVLDDEEDEEEEEDDEEEEEEGDRRVGDLALRFEALSDDPVPLD